LYWFDSELLLKVARRFPRGFEAMDFFKPSIEFKRDGIEVFLIKDGEVGALGQVLAQQAVGVFIAA